MITYAVALFWGQLFSYTQQLHSIYVNHSPNPTLNPNPNPTNPNPNPNPTPTNPNLTPT